MATKHLELDTSLPAAADHRIQRPRSDSKASGIVNVNQMSIDQFAEIGRSLNRNENDPSDAGRLNCEKVQKMRRGTDAIQEQRKRLQKLIESVAPDALARVAQAVELAMATRDDLAGHGSDLSAPTKASDDDVLPPLPDGFAWPTVKFDEYRLQHRGNIIDFLRDESVGWQKLIREGLAELRALRTVDPSAKYAIDNYTRKVKGVREEPRELPHDCRFLTLKESNDRYVRRMIPEFRTAQGDQRLLKVLGSRIKRGAGIL